jgi:hypothetical protein
MSSDSQPVSGGRVCALSGCENSLEGYRAGARYCSAAHRVAAHRASERAQKAASASPHASPDTSAGERAVDGRPRRLRVLHTSADRRALDAATAAAGEPPLEWERVSGGWAVVRRGAADDAQKPAAVASVPPSSDDAEGVSGAGPGPLAASRAAGYVNGDGGAPPTIDEEAPSLDEIREPVALPSAHDARNRLA